MALLAMLKAGGAYVPLDPSLPAERLATCADDAGAARRRHAAPALAERVPSGAAVRVDVDADEVVRRDRPEAPRARRLPGGPGVRDLHLGLHRPAQGRGGGARRGGRAPRRAWRRVHGIVPEDRVLQFASAGFDVSLEQVFFPLLTGATLVLRGAELWSAAEFRARVRALGDHRRQPAAGVLAGGARTERPRTRCAGVRLLLIGGDALPARRGGRAAAPARLVNCYGPTETRRHRHGVRGAERGAAGDRWRRSGGRFPGATAYVLDARGAPVPVGVAGELYIGGPLLARGYLGRPALTAERFVPDPFGGEPGGAAVPHRRPGALARDGDDRVPGAHRLPGEGPRLPHRAGRDRGGGCASHAAVRDAVVLAREDAPGDKRLVAYLVGRRRTRRRCGRTCRERLPEYMVPAAYVRLDALPLTPNGKVDRKALPAPGGRRVRRARVRGAVRRRRSRRSRRSGRSCWARSGWAGGDHFFELGGHSLLAVRVVSRVRQALGVEVSPRDLFERPVLADFARGLETAARAEAPAIAPVDRSAALPLSFAQQRLWFLEQLGGPGAAYHIPMRLRLRGELDRGALERALDRIVARHEALRTTFPTVDGEPVQRIAPVEESGFRLVEHDLRASPDAEDELRRLVADEAGAPFDLARGPLIRGRLVRMAADDHVLLLTMHHIVSDGWSAGVLFRELGALYAAFARGEPDPLPPLPVQYADYAAWHRRWVDGAVLEAQAEYWTRTLAGAPELLELPADRPRPPRQDFAGASVNVELDEALTAALKTLSQRHGTTLFMTLLAGWAAVLARLSGQDDVVIGTPSANRGQRRDRGADRLLRQHAAAARGPLRRAHGGGAAGAGEGAGAGGAAEPGHPVRAGGGAGAARAQPGAHPALPGDVRLAERAGRQHWSCRGCSGRRPRCRDPRRRRAKFDLTLTLGESGGRHRGGAELRHRALRPGDGGALRRLPAARAGGDGGGRAQAGGPAGPALREPSGAGWWRSGTRTDAGYPAGACVHELFEAQAARTPDAVALVLARASG